MAGHTSQFFDPEGLPNLSGRIHIIETAPFAYGGLADVWKGQYKDKSHRLVAVKIIRTYIDDPEYAKERNDRLIREAQVWSRLTHPMVTPFFGISFDVERGQSGAPALVCPYYRNGNLSDYLEAHPKANAIKMLAEAAAGLDYLHSLKPSPIIHGDVKASNILVNDNEQACLADFGLSRMLEVTGFTTRSIGGSWRWMAYELVVPADDETENLPLLTQASDVWAFGMTILQIMTGKIPYHHLSFDPTVVFAILKRKLPSRPLNFPDAMWRLLQHCWTYAPGGRPSMRAVTHALGAFSDKKSLSKEQIDTILDEFHE